MAGTTGMAGDDGEASVCRSAEVYWAVVGVRKEYVRKMAAVEGVEAFARAAAGRFLAWTMCDPERAGVAENRDGAMVNASELSLGGSCWRGLVGVVELGVGAEGSSQDWEEAIARVSGGCTVTFTDGSRDEAERVAGGWCDSRGVGGCELVGLVATVWDGEVAGLRLALESLPVAPLLVLTDSKAALAAVQNAASAGMARTADLRLMVDQVGQWALAGVEFRFGCVKAHVGWGGMNVRMPWGRPIVVGEAPRGPRRVG